MRIAREKYETYQTPEEERARLAHWLKSATVKIVAAQEAGEPLKTLYAVSVNTRPIIEGLWAANDKPVPPQGSVWAWVDDLSGPPERREALERLFAGEPQERIRAALDLIDWAVSRFEGGRLAL